MYIVLLCVCSDVLYVLVAGLLARSQNLNFLQPATTAQVFLGFLVSKRECSGGSQDSKLQLHATHVALPT
jgi:hypothetical protein